MFHAVFAVVLCFSSSAHSLQGETERLEAVLAHGKANVEDRTRLAEIYFLTSRCDDVKRVRPPIGASLACACGGECAKGSRVQKSAEMQRLFAKGAKWTDSTVKSVWKRAYDIPEAQYWALKILRATRGSFADPKLSALREEIEKSLAALEVNP